jgi:hypothetical protein
VRGRSRLELCLGRLVQGTNRESLVVMVTRILSMGIAALTLGLLAGVLSAPDRYAYQPNPTQPAVQITSEPSSTPSATKPATTASRSEAATTSSKPTKSSQVTVKVKTEEKTKGNQGKRGERADKKKRQQ